MARSQDPKHKQCRRLGERCSSPKCPVIRRNYPPGQHGQSRPSRLSGFGQQLREKQKMRRMYGILERQFAGYYHRAIRQAGNTGEAMFRLLELRLDNVVFRLGFCLSREQARQLVSHGHIFVNGKRVNIPSAQVKVGDTISVQGSVTATEKFQDLIKSLGTGEPPRWMTRDLEKFAGTVSAVPGADDFPPNVHVPLIIEYYSR